VHLASSEQMQMEMGHCLASIFTSIDHDAIAGAEMFLGAEFFCDGMQVAGQGRVGCIGLCQRWDVFFGHDQEMHRRLGVDVREGVCQVVFIDLLRWNGSSDDFAEDAIHGVRITQRERVSAPSHPRPAKAVCRGRFRRACRSARQPVRWKRALFRGFR